MMRRAIKYGLAAVAILALGLLLLFYTPYGLSLVGRLAAPLTGNQVRVESLGGLFPNRLHAARLEVADANGVWLRVDNAALEWSALALLRNHISIYSVATSRITVLRRPLPSQSSGGETPRIDIARLSAPRIALGSPVIGRAVELSAEGSLHFVSLQDMAADLLVTRTGSSDRYRIAGALRDGVARGNAVVAEGIDGILGKLANLPGLGPVNLSAQAAGNERANTINFRLSAGPLTAGGHGVIALAGRHADIEATLAAPAMAPRPDMSWGALSGDIRIQGRFDAPQVSGNLQLLDGRLAGVAVKAVTVAAAGNAGSVTLQGTADKILLPGGSPDLLAAAPLRFTARAELQDKTRPVRLSVTHPLLRLDAVAQTAGPLRATADLTLPSLTPFGALAQTAMAGNATLHAALEQQDARLHATMDGTVLLQGTGLPARLLGRTQITLAMTMEDGDITASHLQLNGAAVKAEADGTMRRKRLAYGMTLNLTDLSRLADGWQGLPALSGATLTMGGHLDGAPLSLQASLTGAKARRAKLTAHWRSLDAQADLAITAGGALGGTAKLALRQLSDIAAFTGTTLSGSAGAAIIFHDRHGKTDADIDASIAGLAAASAKVQTVSLRGTVSDLTSKPHADLSLQAGNIAAQGWTGGAQAKLAGPLEQLQVVLETQLSDASAAKLTAHGAAQLDLPGSVVTLTALKSDWRGLKLELDAPATLRFADGLAVDRLTAHLNKGRIAIAGKLMPELALTASVDDIALADFAAFVPGVGPQGTVSATADLRGSLAAPTGHVTLRGRGLRAAVSTGGVPSADITLTAQLMGDHAVLDASMAAGANAQMSLTGTVPLMPGGAMALRTAGKADLALLDALTAASGRRIRGMLTFEGTAAGTFAAPRIAGHGGLANGEVQDYAQGLLIRDIAASFVSDGTRLTLNQLTARAGTGTLAASGAVDLTAPDLPIDMKMEMRDARPVASDMLTADLSGTVALTGHVKTGMVLAGTVRVAGATINLPETFPPEVAVLNVRRRGQLPPTPPPRQTRVQMDLTVATTGPVFVRGHGMDADMGGSLHVAGTTGAPAVSGSLRMNRGTFSAAGQTLTFTSGDVRFDGAGLRGRLDPVLNFVAQTVSGGVTATFAVTGYASSPKIALSSTPQLPQDEVVAHLLFQQSVKQLGPLQLAGIAQAAAAMGGIGGGFNPLGAVRNTLGLDRLSVGSAQGGAGGTESQTTVEAGRYVTRNVYVGVRQNLSGGTQTQVQVDLTRQLKAQATLSTGASAVTAPSNTTQDTGSSVGLSYQFEY
jgi:translocation and assembly module TamB